MDWRKKFRFQVLPSDGQLKAIGLVCVSWTIVENTITMIAFALYKDDPVAQAAFSKQTFSIRLRLTRDLLDAKLAEPHRTKFISYIDQIGSVKIERDRIIHGIWGGDATEEGGAKAASHTFNWMGGKPRFDWRLTYARIMDTAHKIDKLAYAPTNYLAAVMGEPRQFLIDEALRKISR